MIMMTIIIPANTIFFLFEGFFGGGLTAFGMDEGTSGVGERSFGEKSFGMNRFSARGAFEDSEATFGGNINSGSEDGVHRFQEYTLPVLVSLRMVCPEVEQPVLL